MNITAAHLDFWAYHKGPSIFRKAFPRPPEIPIPDRDKRTYKLWTIRMQKSNTLNLLRCVHERDGYDGMISYMQDLCLHSDDARRAADCRNWLQKMGRPVFKKGVGHYE